MLGEFLGSEVEKRGKMEEEVEIELIGLLDFFRFFIFVCKFLVSLCINSIVFILYFIVAVNKEVGLEN